MVSILLARGPPRCRLDCCWRAVVCATQADGSMGRTGSCLGMVKYPFGVGSQHLATTSVTGLKSRCQNYSNTTTSCNRLERSSLSVQINTSTIYVCKMQNMCIQNSQEFIAHAKSVQVAIIMEVDTQNSNFMQFLCNNINT